MGRLDYLYVGPGHQLTSLSYPEWCVLCGHCTVHQWRAALSQPSPHPGSAEHCLASGQCSVDRDIPGIVMATPDSSQPRQDLSESHRDSEALTGDKWQIQRPHPAWLSCETIESYQVIQPPLQGCCLKISLSKTETVCPPYLWRDVIWVCFVNV